MTDNRTYDNLADAGHLADLKGHKVFVFERAGSLWMEMVNDEPPLTRMTLVLSADDAREIAQMLIEVADARG